MIKWDDVVKRLWVQVFSKSRRRLMFQSSSPPLPSSAFRCRDQTILSDPDLLFKSVDFCFISNRVSPFSTAVFSENKIFKRFTRLPLSTQDSLPTIKASYYSSYPEETVQSEWMYSNKTIADTEIFLFARCPRTAYHQTADKENRFRFSTKETTSAMFPFVNRSRHTLYT